MFANGARFPQSQYSRTFRDRLPLVMSCLRRMETKSRFLRTLCASLPWFCVQLDFCANYTQKFALNASHLLPGRRVRRRNIRARWWTGSLATSRYETILFNADVAKIVQEKECHRWARYSCGGRQRRAHRATWHRAGNRADGRGGVPRQIPVLDGHKPTVKAKTPARMRQAVSETAGKSSQAPGCNAILQRGFLDCGRGRRPFDQHTKDGHVGTNVLPIQCDLLHQGPSWLATILRLRDCSRRRHETQVPCVPPRRYRWLGRSNSSFPGFCSRVNCPSNCTVRAQVGSSACLLFSMHSSIEFEVPGGPENILGKKKDLNQQHNLINNVCTRPVCAVKHVKLRG